MRLKNVEDVYSLAPMQKGILFHIRYAPQSEIYFSQFICTIEQPLDVDAFRQAWQQMLTRHAVLRTAFLWEGLDEPLQLVNRQVELPWEHLDWRGLPAAEQEARLAAFLTADRARGFDLAVAPLLRLFLIQTTEQTYTFISSSSHLLMDGWSRVLLLQEVSACYKALVRGQSPRLPRVRPYRDYIGWLQRQDLSCAEDYWRKILQGFTVPTTLGRAHQSTSAREEEQQPLYTSRELSLSGELTAALQDFVRQQQLTLNTLLQGAWAIVLSRYSGEQDIVFGATVAGRPTSLPGSESIVGLFINTLPLRVAVQPAASLIPWLKYLQEQQATMLEYQHVPLVDIQQWSDIPHGQQLFESIFVFENTLSAVAWEQTEELQFRGIRGGVEQTNYPLTLVIGPDSELLLRLSYDTHLFAPEMIDQLLNHLRNLLAHMIASPSACLRDLLILSTDEQRRLLVEWNQTQRPYPANRNVQELFEAQVIRAPDAVALVFEDQSLTYHELNTRANQLAWYLQSKGVALETRIAICMERCLALIVGLLGILKAGGAYVPLDPDYPAERLAFMLQNAHISLLLTQQHLLALFPESDADIICLDSVITQLQQYNPANLLRGAKAQNLAYVMYTSGSTGRPKGVEITHQNIVRLLCGVDYAQLDNAQTFLQMAPVAFDAATFEIWGALLYGGRCVLYPEKVPTARGIEAAVKSQGVSTLWLTTSLFNMVIEEEPAALSGLHQLLVGGEALSVPHIRHALEQLPTVQLINGYGPTESTTFTCCYPIATPLAEGVNSIPLGRPISNTQVYVLDRQMQPVPCGTPGELYIGGAGLARGYLNRPDLTAERFVPHPFVGTRFIGSVGDLSPTLSPCEPGARLYRTGDLVRYLPDGNLDFLGRQDQQVKLRGFRVELGEIEATLCQHPAVREAIVLVHGENAANRQLVAYIVAQPEHSLVLEDVRRFLQDQLPSYMVPSVFIPLEHIPLNLNGKLDRRALPPPDLSHSERRADTGTAHNPVEELLVEQWVEMLGVQQVGIHDNFFELGGHSLLATQAVSRLYKAFGVELPLRNFFEAPTVAATARYAMNAVTQVGHAPDLLPSPRPEKLPLSFAQQRLWFLHQFEPEAALYNVRVALSFQGPLHIAAFERAVQTIIARHEALRTTFSAVDGLPQQHIVAALILPLPLIDLQTLTPVERQAVIQCLAQQEARLPFDLAHGPLLRVTLLRLSPQEHVLLLTMHHIVSDEWSLNIFGRELDHFYRAYIQNVPVSSSALPVQYADFALWQYKWLQGSVLQAQLDFWREYLRDAPLVLELPTDHPRLAKNTARGGTYPFTFPLELSRALKALSLREGVTLFMTLLAAFQVLLARYSGQQDIVVGSPIANRTQVEIEDLIGFFVNTLVLRTDISDNPSFQDLLHKVRETALEAYAHQDLPFEKLVEELSPERNLSHHPLFQVMFALQHISESAFELAGLTPRSIPVASGTAQFDLALSLLNGAQGLEGQFTYNASLFDASTIEHMAAHFQGLLSAIVASPDLPVFNLPLLTESEKQQLLVEWNTTPAHKLPAVCVHELFEAQAECRPDAIAVTYEEEQLSYSELNQRANQLAHNLAKQGVGPEQLVGLCMERSLELVIGILAILKAGGAYVPLDPRYPTERLNFVLRDAQIAVLLTQEQFRGQMEEEARQIICLDCCWQDLAGEPVNNPIIPLHPNNLAYVIYTSGSTGHPKGVTVSHVQVVRLFASSSTWLPFDERDTWTLFHSAAFDFSVWELWGALLYGGRLIVVPYWYSRSPAAFMELLRTQQVTVLNQTPSAFRQLVQAEQPAPIPGALALRLIIFGGEALDLASVHAWFARYGDETPQLVNMYGITETTVHVTYAPLTTATGDDRALSPIGRPLPDLQVYVLDTQKQLAPIGVVGELYIGGAGLARGYLGQPALTAERFVPHPWSHEPGDRLYKTGDLARYLPDGHLDYRGRNDVQVKIRGHRIEPGEIEAALTQHTFIDEAIVLTLPDIRGDLSLVAYIVTQQKEKIPRAELWSFLRAKLPEHMFPSTFIYLDALPLTVQGKVDWRALPVPSIDAAEISTDSIPAHTPIEELLSGLWSELLGLKYIGIHDNFFALGGHSLLAVRLISRIRTLLQVEIPVRALFESPTIADLAKLVERMLRETQGLSTLALVPVAREQELPLSFAQQRLWFLEQLQPGNTAYTIPLPLRLKGTLHVLLLEQSIRQIVQRHEILRTTFQMKDERPIQLIEPTAHVYLPLVDISTLLPAQREDTVHQLMRQETLRPFDLLHGPLLRVTLLRLSANEHVLLLTMHHIIADEWSMDVLNQELNTLYQAFVTGEASPLATLPLQYADFALWQRQMQQGSALQMLLDYWREQLHGMQTALNLPTDYPRPAQQTFRGASYDLRLSRELSEGLKTLSTREGMTLFMTLLAAFQILLARYSGQEDIAVGSPIANRSQLELEGLIGFFVNTLVLRTDLSGNPSFEALLQRVRETALGAYTHQDLPFEQLVDLLQPERDLSRNPLFQVMFVLQQASRSIQQSADLTIDTVPMAVEQTKFDLTLTLVDEPEGIWGSFTYNCDLFEARTVGQMAQHLQVLLAGIVAAPQQRIFALPLLTQSERQLLLADWNATSIEYPQEECLHMLVEAQVERSPDCVAVAFEDQQLTYRDLNERANYLAHKLHAVGCGPEARIAVCLERSLELVVSLLAVLKAGGAYVPLDPTYPIERLQWMLADSQVTALITQSASPAMPIPSSIAIFHVDPDYWETMDFLSASLSRSSPLDRGSVCAQNQAYVIYTSGSTGRPKGVQVTHANVARLFAATNPDFHFDRRDVWTMFHSYAFDFSVWELWGALLHGGRLVLVPYLLSRSPEEFYQLLCREGITVLNQTPSAFSQLIWAEEASSAAQVLALRLVIFGGEALDFQQLQPWFERHGDQLPALVNMYGITETTVHVTRYRLSMADLECPVKSIIGGPIPGLQAYILDQQQQPVPIGVAGELFIGGAGLTRGYLRRPELTAERFLPDLFGNQPGARLYKTGDLARFLPNGQIAFLGRTDHQVKIHGFRIEPGEIEIALASLPYVREVAVVVREDMPGGSTLVAYVVPGAAAAFSSQRLRTYLQERLPKYMIPAAFVEMRELPTTANGKLDRQRLPPPNLQKTLEQLSAEPMTGAEKILASIWAEILGTERIGIHTNFFEIGGDSILCLLIVARARKAGLYITPKQMFQHQTISGLAAVATSMMNATAQPIANEDDQGSVPLLPVQCWFVEQRFPEPWHWNQAMCMELPHDRIKFTVLQQALAALIEHHATLRLRLLEDAQGWRQSISQADSLISMLDLSMLPADEQKSAFTKATTRLQTSLNLASGPLLRALYVIRGADQPDLLVMSIHHMAIDTVSWRILLEDLRLACSQLGQTSAVQLPAKTSSFKRWCEALHSYADSPEVLAETAYWLTPGREDIPLLPLDYGVTPETNTEATTDRVNLSLEVEETRELLHDVPAAYHTQINELLLTALLLACAPWLGRRKLLVDLEGHGREALFDSIDISRTVGWFTCIFPVLLDLEPLAPSLFSRLDLGQALKTIKEQVRAVPQHGIGYGVLRYLSNDDTIRTRLAELPQAQISFNYLGQFVNAQDGPDQEMFRPVPISTGPQRSLQGRRPYLLDVSGLVVDGQLQINWAFSTRLHRRETIEMLAQRYIETLRALIVHCRKPGAGGYTPSDFPELELSQSRLDKILNKLQVPEQK